VYQDLRDFISTLDQNDELINISKAGLASEIGVISELLYERDGPAPLFDSIPGHPKGQRILANPFSTLKRAVLALGWPADMGIDDAMKKFDQLVNSFTPTPPNEVSDGPVMENVLKDDEVDLMKFPAPRWHDSDGGAYIGTGDVVITRDPESSYVNLGTYRVMIHDARTCGLYINPQHHGSLIRNKYWSQGKSCPVAVCLGQEPALTIAASHVFELGWGQPEYDLAGYLRNGPVRVIIDEITGLPIPATAEIVLIGYCLSEMRDEGPFGEWVGYSAHGKLPEPIIKVEAIYYRNNPINLGCPPQKPRGPTTYFFGLPTLSTVLLDRLKRTGIQGILDVWPLSRPGVTVIKVRQLYAGHAKQVAYAAAALEPTMGRFIITVDEDVNIRDPTDVLWATATRCNPESDTEVMKDTPTTPLDPRLPPDKRRQKANIMSKIIIDACRPFEWATNFPPVLRSSEAVRQEVLQKWRDKLSPRN
jgi:UbiD family decarboxylase